MKVLTRSFNYNRINTLTVCYTLSHIIEIDINAIKALYDYSITVFAAIPSGAVENRCAKMSNFDDDIA